VQEGGPEARARLVIADDHQGTRVLLRTLLSLHPEIDVVGEAENGEEAARLAVSGEADIALLDIEMPRMDPLAQATLDLRIEGGSRGRSALPERGRRVPADCLLDSGASEAQICGYRAGVRVATVVNGGRCRTAAR
jgi:DNA-binding NarL/FixJ family response regulator